MDIFYSFVENFISKNNYKNTNANCNVQGLELFTINIQDEKNKNKILEELINFIKTNSKDLVLLDTNSNKNLSIVEKFVYELGLYHLRRLGLIGDHLVNSIDKYYIEFWFKCESDIPESKIIHEFHVDKDEELFTKNNILKCPILSTITYLSDSIYPLVITNIKYDDLSCKENLLNKEKEFIMVYPKELRHICFDCKYFHGVVDLEPDTFIHSNKGNEHNESKENERIVLVFNIWKNYIPIERNYFISNKIKTKLYPKEQNILSIKPYSKYKIYSEIIPNSNMSKYILNLISDSHDKYFYKKNINLELAYRSEVVKITSY